MSQEAASTSRYPRPRKLLKISNEIPVFIVEDHHEVLPHIYRLIGAKRIPLQDNTLIHFDAHPDMLVPTEMKADVVFDKFQLFSKLSIENWIIPAVYAGHFTKLVWIKPFWARQIENGTYQITIGKEKTTGEIRLDCPVSYFVSEAMYAPATHLDQTKTIVLDVITFTGKLDDDKAAYSNLDIDKPNGLIFDIDLDFFSTRNPFKTLYDKANLYMSLKDLYWFELPAAHDSEILLEAVKTRREQLLDLQRLWSHIARKGCTTYEPNPPSQRWVYVKEIADRVITNYPNEEIDWAMIHDAGCTWDDSELPDYISSTEEMLNLLESLKHVASNLPMKPNVITVSRSSDDDYCPHEYVEWIQEHVIDVLKSTLECKIKKAYLEE